MEKSNKKYKYLHKNFLFIISIILMFFILFAQYKIIFSKADESSDLIQQMNENEIIEENTIIENTDENTNENIINQENTVLEENQENVIENEVIENTIANNVVENTTLIDEPQEPRSGVTEISETTGINLTANLWNTNLYGDGSGTGLTEEGTEISGWECEETKYLQIDPLVPADGNTYKVYVIMPQEFYVIATDLIKPTGYRSVEFEKNDDIVINSSTTLEIEQFSGTTVYTLNEMGISGTIQLEVAYDVRLWDKQANSILTKPGVSPVEVVLTKTDSQNVETEVKRVSISKATSGAALVDTVSYYANVPGNTASFTEVTVMKDVAVTLINTIYTHSGLVRYKYYPTLTINIQLPKYTYTDGTVYYVPVDLSKITFSSIKYKSRTIDSSDIANGKIKVTIKDAYWNTGTVLKMVTLPLTEEILALDVNEYTFSGGTTTYYVEGKNGTTGIKYENSSLAKINYQKNLLEEVTVSRNTSTQEVSVVNRPEEAVSLLGGFYLKNVGTGDSCGKTIEVNFDTGNTNHIRVTTYNALADNVQEYIILNYTLVDENGNRVFQDAAGNRVEEGTEGAIGEWSYNMKNQYYKTTTLNNLKNTITRANLPESQRNYYFKSFRYRIEKIRAGASLLTVSAMNTLTGAGNFVGYVSGVTGGTSKNTIKVVSDNPEIATLNYSLTTSLKSTSKPSHTVSSLEFSKDVISAGQSVNATGKVSITSYPYGNSTWLRNITIGIILTKGVSINESSVNLKTSGGQVISDYEVTSEEISDGYLLWKIHVDENAYIGYAKENLGTLSVGSVLNFSVQLDTSYTMNGTTLFAKDMFLAAGYKQTNSAGGANDWAKTVDKYDLNENGSKTDYIAGPKGDVTASCQITPQTASLDINDSITIESNGTISQETRNGIITSSEDIINYNLDIGCFSGGRAEGFEYYIPIEKSTSATDNFLIRDSETGKYDFKLKEYVSETGSNIFDVKYAFEPGLTYAEAQDFTEWYSKEEIEANPELLLENVSMIKLVTAEEGIHNGDSTRITVKLMYANDNFQEEAGLENIWSSGGYYNHINSDRESAGNFATEGISVKINLSYGDTFEDLTLTAAKGMNPIIPGNSNTTTLSRDLFPTFRVQQNFEIVEVETYNVNLVDREYINNNIDLPGSEANKTFAITVKMENGEETDILEDAGTTAIPVGLMPANSKPEFVFKIYNADALTDNSQIRYIIVTLQSDNGITIKQKININREIAAASDPKSAIVTGKRYLAFDETNESVVISQDSSFTAQFITEYIPDTYENQKIIFNNNLPKGTKIILENLTDSANPTYWHYTVTTSKSNINLTEFLKMGKTSNEKYVLPTGINIINEKLLVIVDFSDCTNYFDDGTSCSVQMILSGTTNIDDVNSEELTAILKNKHEFSLSDISNVRLGENINIGYSVSVSEGSASKYDGRKMSIVISTKDSIPEDLAFQIGETTYYQNSKSEFIIPIGDIKTGSDMIEGYMTSNMIPNRDETYEFEASLWISATANHNAPKLGEKVAVKEFEIESKSIVDPSLKVKSMSSRVIHRDELGSTESIQFKCIPIQNMLATVELQQKIGSAYQKVTDKLSQVNSSTVHNMGAYDIPSIEGTNTVEFKLSSATENGTYRLVFKIYDSNGNQVLEVPYNFIVTK